MTETTDKLTILRTVLTEETKAYIKTFPSQTAAAQAIGTKQPEISAFMSGQVLWSIERLIKIMKEVDSHDSNQRS